MKEKKKKSKQFWKYVLIFGMFEFSWTFVWGAYYNYLPVFLQAGGTDFNLLNASSSLGFGFGAFLTGILMIFDNAVGFFLTPFWGAMTDYVKSRKKIVVISGLISGVLVMAIPAALTAITPGNSGNTKELIIPFAIFGTTVIAMLVMWALNTAAQKGLMYTVISSKEYNKMTSLVMFAGAVGYIVSSVLNSVLYKVASYLPFVASGAVLFITMILFALLLKEPKGLTAYNEDDAEVKKLGKNPIKALSKSIKMIEKGELKNIITVMSAKIFGIFGIMGIQTYASSYGVNYLGINESEVPLLVVVFFLGYLFMALSSGFIADKVGRGPVVKVGFFFAAFMGLGLMLTKNMLLVKGTFFIVGMGNGMLDVMITTMVADSITNKKHMGVAMSTVMSIGKLSTIVAVPIFGYILEKSGNQFGPVFPVMLIVPLIGFIVFLRLPKGFGEIREENKSQKSQTV